MNKEGEQPPPYQDNPDQPSQPYPNQPYPTQPYPTQPYPTQPYPTQAYPAQPYPEQPPPAQQYPGQPQGPPPAPPIYVQQLPPQQVNSNNDFMNNFRQAIPTLSPCMAIFCCIINWIIPGFGTIIAGFASLCCGQKPESKCRMFWINFGVGWAQFFLIIFGIGWVWSIFWGFLMIGLAFEKKTEAEPTTAVVYSATTETADATRS